MNKIEHYIRRTIKVWLYIWPVWVLLFVVGLGIGGLTGGKIAGNAAKKAAQEQIREADAKVQKTEKELYDLKAGMMEPTTERPWNLMLVNAEHPMEEGYVPELVTIQEGCKVDARIAEAAKKMLSDAKAAGMKIQVCSAYRSVERQKQVFGDSMKQRVKSGMDYWEAFCETKKNVAEPGTSEHAMGLALDLISDQYEELDERQESTKESKWLAEHCYKYGFILRYPPQKTGITGIIYEPWHYRYVGVEHAEKIMKAGITLEEYLQEYEQTE